MNQQANRLEKKLQTRCLGYRTEESSARAINATMDMLYAEFIKDVGSEKRHIIVSKLIENLGLNIENINKLNTLGESRLGAIDIEEILERYVRTGRSPAVMNMRERDFLRSIGLLGRFPSLMELWSLSISSLSTQEWPLFILIDEFDAASPDWIDKSLLHGFRQIFDDSLYGLCFVFGLKARAL